MAGVRATILGEDQRQISFATRVLKLLKYKDRELFRETVPDGGGSGEQWVRRHYPRQVALNRQKRSHQQCTLLVTIDGDNPSVRFRKEQLDEALRKSSMPPRGADEPIAIWVPCRNIETWLQHLTGESVDEMQDYKTAISKETLGLASREFVSRFRQWQHAPEEIAVSLPAILDAFEELQRIL